MKQVTNQNTSFTDKWSAAIEKEGYVQIPNLLIWHLGELKITPVEFTVIVGLLSHKWSEDNPFPALSTIANYIGRSRNTVQAAVRSLDLTQDGAGKGLVLRVSRGGNETNEFDFTPLIEHVGTFAQPIEKSTPTHRKINTSSYRKTDNEEYQPNNTHLSKRRDDCGKPTLASDVLMSRYPGIANKS